MGKALNLSSRIVESALQEIKQDKVHNKTNEWGPFKPLPNCRNFRIELAGYDQLFKEHGIKKRLESKKFLEKYRNGPLNRYMLHQIKRLSKARQAQNETLY